MKSILFVGDCHVDRLRSAKFAGQKTDNLYFHNNTGVSGYGMDYSKLGAIPETDLVVPMFGYIDIKVHLPRFDNVDEAVERYIKNLTDRFSTEKIRLTEPIPQFIDNLGNGTPNYDFEIRYKYYNQYLESLYKIASDNNLAEPINLRKIWNTDKLDKSFMHNEYIKIDAVSKEKSLILINSILKVVD